VRQAIFLDRDGTINLEKDYLYSIEEFEFIPGAAEAVSLLNMAGFFVAVVSNQSGIARGYYTEEDVEKLHRHISAEIKKRGGRIDAWLYCPHHPSGRGSHALPCRCRKPLPGMLHQAEKLFDIDLSSSIMIGDKLSDIEAGIAAGCLPILVRTGYGISEEERLPEGVAVYDDILEAARSIVHNLVPV